MDAHAVREWLLRLVGTFTKRRRDTDLEQELRVHLELAADAARGRGSSADDGNRTARIQSGGVAQAMDAIREQRGIPWLEDVARDVRYGGRRLLRDRWFTAAATVALAMGIGMTATMFTIVNAMIRGLPVDKPAQIMSLHTRDAAGRWRGLGVSYLDFQDFRASTRTFAGLAAFSPSAVTLGDEKQASERASGCYVSANAFRLLRVKPMIGRDFVATDDRVGAPPVAILGAGLWRTRYRADPAVIGQVIRVNGVPSTVIGVMPEGFRFPVVSDMWEPLARMPQSAAQTRGLRVLQVFGRLADQSTPAQAQAEAAAIAARLAREHPSTNGNTEAVVASFPGHFAPDSILLALMSGVGFVLLLACINVANLLLGRSVHRSHEVAVRLSLGATRWRLVRQLLIESGVLVLASGGLGFGLTLVGVWLFGRAVSDITFPYYIQWTLDAQVVLFIGAVCIGCGVCAGVLPAVYASRTTVTAPAHAKVRTTTSADRRRVTASLVSIEFALSLVLLASATLMMRSYLAVNRSDAIVDASRVHTMIVSLSGRTYASPDRRDIAYKRLEQRIDGIPGVSATAFASVVPFAGAPSRQISIDGLRPLPGQPLPIVSYVAIRGRYFDVLGLRLLRGRTFTDQDATPASQGAIVNERLAAMFFGSVDPLGRRICLTIPHAMSATSSTCATIVGISPTVRQQYFQDIDPVVYVPDRADTAALTLMVRSSTPTAVAPAIRAAVVAIDPDTALNAIAPLDRAMTQSRWGHRVFGGTLTVFAGVGLLLAAIGLYATTAFSVAQRTREIGVRMALGARPDGILWLFATRAALPVGVGIVLGLAGAVAVGNLLRGLLVQTGPTDLRMLVGITGLLAAVSLVACLLPARRASRLHPVVALRHD